MILPPRVPTAWLSVCRVSLKTLIDTGRGDLLSGEMGLTGQNNLSTKQKMLIQVASFLHRELPIRLAHRVRDLESVPDMLAQKSVQQVSLLTVCEKDSSTLVPQGRILGSISYRSAQR